MFVEGLGADRSHERMHHRIKFLTLQSIRGVVCLDRLEAVEGDTLQEEADS